VVPEVNRQLLSEKPGLIANPNCSAAILAVALAPLHRVAGLESLVVATYQSASGAGARAVQELENQVREFAAGREPKAEVFPHVLAFNLFSHNSPVGKDGYNEEETKMVEETKKIFNLPTLRMTPTCVRVPIPRAHSEAVVARFARPLTVGEARKLLSNAPGVRVVDEPQKNLFPMPKDASGELEVLVGRIRAVVGDDRSLAFFVSGDQLLKGAAWNAVQIAEELGKLDGLPS
jgi:aspartate-semialdehyde dehydrogenase